VLLRETAPLHKLNEKQRAQALDMVLHAKEALSRLEGVVEHEDRK
jgi:hypothetical protein